MARLILPDSVQKIPVGASERVRPTPGLTSELSDLSSCLPDATGPAGALLSGPSPIPVPDLLSAPGVSDSHLLNNSGLGH